MKYLLILLGLAFCHTSYSQVKPYKNKWDLKTSSKTTYTKKQKKTLIQFFEENIDATCCSSKDIEFFKGNKEYFLSVKMKAGKLELYYYYDNKDVIDIDQLLFEIGEKTKL
jgi:hypothetical protein